MVPLVSILIPSYNHEAYVAAAVESVLAQDHPRLELIVIDDGSRDGTPAVLKALRPACEKRCERVEMVFQENAGTCRTVNRLLDLARGDFCMIVASDDQLVPGALTALLRPMLEDGDLGVVVGENALMDGTGARCYWDADRRTVTDPDRAAFATLNDYIVHASGVDRFGPEFGAYAALLKSNHVANGCLIRRAALDRCARMTPQAPLEDYWLHLQLSKVTRYRSVRELTFRYRWHATNASKAIGSMLAMTRLTLEHEAACFRDTLTPGNRRALDEVLAAWRGRVLLVLRRQGSVRADDIRRFGVVVDAVEIDGGEESLNAALRECDVRGYGFVAYLADGRFLPSYSSWERMKRCFDDPRVAVVAGAESFVARAEAVSAGAREVRAIRRLPGPGIRRRLVHFFTGRFR